MKKDNKKPKEEKDNMAIYVGSPEKLACLAFHANYNAGMTPVYQGEPIKELLEKIPKKPQE